MSGARLRPAVPAVGVRAAAEALWQAAATGVPVPPVRAMLEYPDQATGYAVQSLTTTRRLADGAEMVGRKIGLTSAAVQRQLGVDTPDTGVLFADMRRGGDEPIDPAGLLQPRIEAEVAFVLGADLTGAVSAEAVRAATECVVAALEIVDSRIAGWDITLVDTVADNASCGLFVLGDEPVPLAGLDLRDLRMTMTDHTGATVSAGTGADCLGDPILAVAWLAAKAKEIGEPLRAGEVILSGALGPMVAVVPGARFSAQIEGLGRVHAEFGARRG